MSVIFRRISAGVLLTVALSAHAYDEAQTNQIKQALATLPHPEKITEFTPAYHMPCRNQGRTEICWSFASSSFFESEQARQHRHPVRISVLYSEYCEFLEKAKRFIRYQGKSRFVAGDLFTGVTETCRNYGALPAELYDQMDSGKTYDQNKLYDELEAWCNQAKAQKVWDEVVQLGEVKAILNKYLGEPPATFPYRGETYTPKSFFEQVIQLNLSDYVLVTSWNYAPFNQFTDLRVPDNWKHNTNYFNIPLPEFYEAFKDALDSGYTLATDVDTSEPSYAVTRRYAFYTDSPVDQGTREQGLISGATTDDHLIHVIAWNKFSGEDWFLAKDSAGKVWTAHHDGYIFVHGNYVKMKFLAFLVHKDAVPKIKVLLPYR